MTIRIEALTLGAALLLSAATPAFAQGTSTSTPTATDTAMTTPVNSDDDDGDEGKWGLLGLLGLAGLLGLKRRDHDNHIHSNDRR